MASVLFQSFYSAGLSTFHLFYIVILGIISKKIKIVSPTFHLSLSKVVTNVILPCFIFSQILNNFRISQYQILFDSFLCCTFIFFFGMAMGFIIAKSLNINVTKNQSNFIAGIFSTPHTTSIPIILIQIVGPVLDNIIPAQPGITPTAEKRGFLYIMINSIFSNLWRWSGSYYLINPEDGNKSVDSEALELKDKEDENKPIQNKDSGIMGFIKDIINAPLITGLCSLLLTISPLVQSYFITPGLILNETLISVNLMVSKSYSFISMFLLGLTIADQIHFGEVETFTISRSWQFSLPSVWDYIWISIMKLVVMPLLACPLLICIIHYVMKCDDVFLFLYLFMAAAPSAINVLVICNYKKAFIQACSSIMIVMYSLALITLTLEITLFIYVIGYLNDRQLWLIKY